ncbi:hypothetical protein I4U23_017720 [Adineta vaga]|nr:hypothetical protein I4U23_017720 [Adineta vaga]
MAEAQLTNQLTRIDSMTNVELRAELKRRGCPTSGNKKDLLAKLRVALQKEYEQALEAASTTSTVDSMSLDGRNNNYSNLQQSPVVPFDVNRSSLNNSTGSSNNYMTPHSGSPMVYSQHMHSGEVPLTYTNLQIHDQATGQYPSVYNLTMNQNVHQPPAPMIPVPQQLTLSTGERHQMYDQSLLHNQQQQQQQQFSPMSTRRQRTSVDTPTNAVIPPNIPEVSPEKKPRTRSKKPSVDSQPNDIQQPIESYVNPPVQNLPPEIIHSIPIQTPIINEPIADNSSTMNITGNDIEVNPLVRQVREERGDSRSPSVDSSSVKSESVIKEIPLSGDRHRLSRSKSPKSRWHHSPSPQQPQTNQPPTIVEEQNSAIATTNDDNNTTNVQVEKSSSITLSAENTNDSGVNEQQQQNELPEIKTQEPTKKEESTLAITNNNNDNNNQQPEKAAPEQQLRPSRSQTSTSSTSTSVMKGLNRSTGSNRMNLSSDVLKTLIPNISLAPESVVTDELEASVNDIDHTDDNEHSDEAILETSIGNGHLLSDSMTIGEIADQKQQRNRTVVIDVNVDSSSLNNDLIGNGSDIRKKTQTPAPPARIASFESKTLHDGKTNALMMDAPVRVKDVTEAIEPPSRIIYIRGLTRPFTLTLLKELLKDYGALVDGELWLDKIKSQCFVTYATLEGAQKAREGLDGCRWPSTNPKTLSVRFGRQDEFEFSKTHDLPPDQMSTDTMDTTNNRLIQEKSASTNKTSLRRSISPTNYTNVNNKKFRPSGNADVREWDLPKFQQQDDKSSTERHVIEEQTVKSTEPPAKGLDDYFRKTKAKPAIYWLPLTEEQIVERTRRQEQRNAERDEEQKKRQLDETARNSSNNKDSKSRSNNNENASSNRSQRRSQSPRDKRRRVSSGATPPPRRDNKRH